MKDSLQQSSLDILIDSKAFIGSSSSFHFLELSLTSFLRWITRLSLRRQKDSKKSKDNHKIGDQIKDDGSIPTVLIFDFSERERHL